MCLSLFLGSCTQNDVLQTEPIEDVAIKNAYSLSKANMEVYKSRLILALPIIEKAFEEEALRSSEESSEEVYKEALSILSQDSKALLLNEGLTNKDLDEIFEGNDAHTIFGALYLFECYRNEDTTLRANVLDCLGRAVIGFDLADFAVRKGLSSVAAKRLALKFAKSMAIKAGLGHLGVILTAATFTHCMLE